MNVISQFRAAALDCGVLIPDPPIIGKLSRCGTQGRERGKDGAYCLYLDGVPAGWFQNFRTGEQQNWHADTEGKLTPAERKMLNARFDAMRKKREAEQSRQYAEATERALQLWEKSPPASPNHPYLRRKQVSPHGLREWYGCLVIPIYGASGKLQSLQFIASDGTKRFLSSGRLSGGFFTIGNPEESEVICLAEGFATAATVHEETGYPVFVAFSTSNLEHVAVSIRARYPKAKIVIAADNDWETAQKIGRNPGIEAAKRAASACGGRLLIPPDLPGCTDWNDIIQAKRRAAL